MGNSEINNRLNTNGYTSLIDDIGKLLELSRRQAARVINSLLTATYWAIGRRIVEFDQGGEARAEYGEELMLRLAADLTAKYGRGFSQRNVEQMRAFYLNWAIAQTASAQLEACAKCPELSGKAASEFVPAAATRSPDPPHISL